VTQSIGEVAEALDVSVDTVRYYEKVGLADGPLRDSGGRRRYSTEEVDWLQFLVRMRSTGMPIRLLQTYAAARRLGPSSAGQRRQILEQHRAEVAARIAELTTSLAHIDYKIDNYARLVADLAGAHHQEEVPA
jgi:DNA-binding transcriptional MerR regulator